MWRNSFATASNKEIWYDMLDDYPLIEASFAQQYGIRLRNENNMSADEFLTLLGGLNSDTPLGNVVMIRSEKDPKKIKSFSNDQKRIRNEWLYKKARTISKDQFNKDMAAFEKIFENMSKVGEKNARK